MDSTGRIFMMKDLELESYSKEEVEKAKLDGLARMSEALSRGDKEPLKRATFEIVAHTRFPMPDVCNARKVLSALEKLGGCTEAPSMSDSALISLTPFEKGYVLGVLTAMRREGEP